MPKAEWELRKVEDRTAKNADQTEFLAMQAGACPLDEGVRDDRTAGAMDDFGSLDAGSAAPWAVDDSEVDDAVGATATEVERRVALMGTAYPFVKEGNTLRYRRSRTLVYELCLAIASAPTIVGKPFNGLPPAFERLCRDVLSCFLGSGTEKLRTGWPIDGEEERTAKFKSVVDKVHARTGEWIWRPGPGMPGDPSHRDVKDLGMDFVAWKRVPDGRRGMLFVLGQCACGDDWTEKFGDLNVQHISDDWFRYFSVAAPYRVFCIPRHVPNGTYFDYVNRKAGFTLDRARLTLIAEANANHEAIEGSPDQFAGLIKLVAAGFEAVQPEQ